MADTWITDLRDLADSSGLLVTGRAGKLASYLARLVEAGSVRPEGAWAASATRCRRSPGRRRCRGHIRVRRSDASATVEWKCPACGDRGLISGWAGSPWDLRAAQHARHGDPSLEVSLSGEEYALLCSLDVLWVETPVLLAGASPRRGRIVVVGTKAELGDLLDLLADEANHVADRRRQRGLDTVLERVGNDLERARSRRHPFPAALAELEVVERTPDTTRMRRMRWPPSRALLEQLVEEATRDAYNESEQSGGFLAAMEARLAYPFHTEVLGMSVLVERIDLSASDEIVAVCRRGRKRQRIAILDLPLPSPPPRGAEWIAAYRYWARGEQSPA